MDPNKPLIIRIKTSLRALNKGAGNLLASFRRKSVLGKASSIDPHEHARLQKELDKRLVYSLEKSRFPTWRQLKYIKKYLSTGERRAFNLSLAVLFISLVFLGGRYYFSHLQLTPLSGGLYREALLGTPSAINPLYASLNDVDSDLSQLVYSSLFKRGKEGELNKDLVSDFFLSGDNKTYDFVLREGVKWHNGNPLTAGDVAFTFNAIIDPAYKSSLRSSFAGVRIEVVDEYNFRFILNAPYAAFLDLLTFGIMPADLWSGVSPESANLAALNLKPVGSGPFRYESWTRDNSGHIKEYKLKANPDYYEKVPYLDLDFKFYMSFEEAVAALNSDEVDGISYLPAEMRESLVTPKSLTLHALSFPQITLVFFNQKNNPALGDKSVRQALAYAIDKRAIVNDQLQNEAEPIDGPILPNSFAYLPEIKKYIYDKNKANELLETAGWKTSEISPEMIEKAEAELASADEKVKANAERILAIGVGKWRKKGEEYLKLSLTTVERKENQDIVAALKSYWEQSGIKTEIQILSAAEMQGSVIRDRNFEALFYAQVLGSDPDPYAFWHSSQASQGYNIASYTNKAVDQLLEEARLNVDPAVRKERYKKFQETIAEDVPVIFMYTPHYTYVQKNDIKGFEVKSILVPKDRFSNITDWYMKTGRRLESSKENK